MNVCRQAAQRAEQKAKDKVKKEQEKAERAEKRALMTEEERAALQEGKQVSRNPFSRSAGPLMRGFFSRC